MVETKTSNLAKSPLSACIFTVMEITSRFFSSAITALGFQPTQGQEKAVKLLADFLFSPEPHSVAVLKGYAGTGKTTLLSAFVKVLPSFRRRVVLLAPTGRAAKVMSLYSGERASTIHQWIYTGKKKGDEVKFVLKENKDINTIFIVDESSMIGGEKPGPGGLFGSGNLLEDLFEFVYSGAGCRIIFVGDTAQLPPVGLVLSPALNEDVLRKNFFLNTWATELKEVVRQEKNSGILDNATRIREQIAAKQTNWPHLQIRGYKDVIRLTGEDLEDALQTAYSRSGSEGSLVICRSNKRANLFNGQIRARIKGFEEDIAGGDQLMVVKNNYFWLPPESRAGFIANGDMIEITRIIKREERFGFRFAEMRYRMLDYPDEPEMESLFLLNTLSGETPALTPVESNRLYAEMQQLYGHIPSARDRYALIKKDPYFNALQVKFSYAITCHKAQGGQWENVFVDQGYLTKDMINEDFLRWLYTAFTRATDKLYLVNFSDSFFGEN